MSDCVIGFDATGVGGWCIEHKRWQCDGTVGPTTVLTIELSEEAAQRLIARAPKELAGFKVLSIERVPKEEA